VSIMRRSILTAITVAAWAVWAAAPAGAATAWTIQAAPTPAGTITPALNDVTCLSATSCFAVGSDNNAVSQIQQTLAEHWNGKTWAVQATPDPSGTLETYLNGVACPSASSCIAVGQEVNAASITVPVAEHWNGTSWAALTVSDPSSGSDPGASLDGISCSSVTSCTAVGSNTVGNGTHESLAEHWNGKTWTVQTTPPAPSGAISPQLATVSCPSASSCTAVGQFTGPGYLVALADHWNGKTWAVQNVPSPNGANPNKESLSELGSVSCSSAASCTAVGRANATGGDTSHLLAEHWNGTTWAIQTVPADPAGTNDDGLNAVSCVSATSCTAVGYASTAQNPEAQKTVAQQWNGKTWTIQATVNPAAGSNLLFGVSCLSATCSATGSSDDGALVERS
jgi:hypothetical protein